MLDQENKATLLNDLIVINNDRVEGYESAAHEAKDLALRNLFEALARDSRKFSSELSLEVAQLGENISTGTSSAGKFYRAWMDIKAKLTKSDQVAILNSCEEGENVALEAYQQALKSNVQLSPELSQMLLDQKMLIAEALETVIKLRDTVYAHA